MFCIGRETAQQFCWHAIGFIIVNNAGEGMILSPILSRSRREAAANFLSLPDRQPPAHD
jgi:hypothetical protein